MSIEDTGFFLLDVPPSLNKVGGSSNWRTWHSHKTRWQRDVETWLMATGIPRGLERVSAYASLRFPVQRRRDTGNFQALLEKAIGDALVNGGWLADDTPDHYRFEDLQFEQELGPKRTTITLLYERTVVER